MKINCQVSVYKKASIDRDIPDANFFLKYSKYFIFICHVHRYMVKQAQPSHEHEPLYGHLCSPGMPLSYNDPNTIPKNGNETSDVQ